MRDVLVRCFNFSSSVATPLFACHISFSSSSSSSLQDGSSFAPSGRLVELVVDGVFFGLYTLREVFEAGESLKNVRSV